MIPANFSEVSQRLGSLLHDARAYAAMPRSATAEEARKKLWVRYGSAKANFAKIFPDGAKLPNWEVEDLKKVCAGLLTSIRDIVGPSRLDAVPPSSGSALTPRPRPPATGVPSTQRSRLARSKPIRSQSPRSSLAEALQELDHADVPPKMRAVRVTGSKGRYAFVVSEPGDAGRYSQVAPERTRSAPATAKPAMRPEAPDWTPRAPTGPDPVIIMPAGKPELMLRPPKNMRINDGPTELLRTLDRLDGLRKIARRDAGKGDKETAPGAGIATGRARRTALDPQRAYDARQRIHAAVAPAFAAALNGTMRQPFARPEAAIGGDGAALFEDAADRARRLLASGAFQRLIAAGDLKGAVRAAIAAGERDDGKLANLLLFARHRDRDPTRPLEPKDSQDDARLAREWLTLRRDQVLPVIETVAEDPVLKVRGRQIAGRLEAFRGDAGQRFKTMIETTARKVGLNPGLLAAVAIAETGGPASYLTKKKVSSYQAGVDDFYAMRRILASAVPAYAAIRWDRKQKPQEHFNDAQTNPRVVQTILFDSGADALLATAVYLKYAEVRLREEAAKLKGDFDTLPVETRFALMRISMAAGRGEAAKRLGRALRGTDILQRDWATPVIYNTGRNATIRAAEAMFLSGWVFAVPLAAKPPVVSPEAEAHGEVCYAAPSRASEAPRTLARQRAAFIDHAARAFTADLIRSAGDGTAGTIDGAALGSIIATAIARAAADHPIVAPMRIASLAMLVHRALRPRMAELAHVASALAAVRLPEGGGTVGRAGASGAAHEFAC